MRRLLLFLALLVALAPQARPAVITVGSGQMYSSMLDALNAAAVGDTLEIHGTIGFSWASPFTWKAGVDIIGAGSGATINESYNFGDTAFATMTNCGDVFIQNITFSAFKRHSNTAGAGNYGGCIAFTATDGAVHSLTVDNCTFSGCEAGGSGGSHNTGKGGAIYVNKTGVGTETAVSITDCSFFSCKATYETEATYCGGGAVFIYATDSTVLVSGCTFGTVLTPNTVVGSAANLIYGGALFVGQVDGIVLTNSTFTGNSAQNAGGALIWRSESGATCAISGCTFTSNSAADRAGGLWIEHMDWTMSNCSFVTNVAVEEGGGLASDADGTITNCVFRGNTAANGGAFCGGGGFSATPSACPASTFSLCVFQDNGGSTTGGAMWVQQPGPTAIDIDIVRCIFVDNDAPDGGTIFWVEDTGLVNTAVNLSRCIVGYTTGIAIATDAGDLSKWTGSVACCDTLECDPRFMEHGPATCAGCVDEDPSWCTWTDDDTANDDFRLNGDSPCFALPNCGGSIGLYEWCDVECDGCWSPSAPGDNPMGIRSPGGQ